MGANVTSIHNTVRQNLRFITAKCMEFVNRYVKYWCGPGWHMTEVAGIRQTIPRTWSLTWNELPWAEISGSGPGLVRMYTVRPRCLSVSWENPLWTFSLAISACKQEVRQFSRVSHKSSKVITRCNLICTFYLKQNKWRSCTCLRCPHCEDDFSNVNS